MTRIFLGWLFNFLESRHCLLDNRQKTLLDNRQKTLDSKQYIYRRYPFQYITIDSSTSDTKLARKPNSNFICPMVLLYSGMSTIYYKNKSGLFSCPYRILDYFSDILFTFLTTFVLIRGNRELDRFIFSDHLPLRVQPPHPPY